MSTMPQQFPDVWHNILGAIWTSARKETERHWPKFLEEGSTTKRFEDDVERVDPGLWNEYKVGSAVDLDSISQGFVQRYQPVAFAKRLEIPEYMKDDAAYDEVFDMVKMLRRTAVQTEDYYAVGILDDCADANVTWGDGVTLASTAHVVRGGGTYSNRLNPALTPSANSVNSVMVATDKQIGSNGYHAGNKVKDWWGASDTFRRLCQAVKSTDDPDTANRAISGLSGWAPTEVNRIPLLASTTQWGARTNAMRGARFVWRQKPRFRKTGHIENLAEVHVGDFRCVVYVADPRYYYFGSHT